MKNLASQIHNVFLGLFLIITATWFSGVVFILGFSLNLWNAPEWLVSILSEALSDPKIRLGETGDFLTGWLTPLALTWFVVTVFMQKYELSLQRKEFEELRKEFQGNRKASERHAVLQDEANKIEHRNLVRSIFEDSKDFTKRGCMLIVNSINSIPEDIRQRTIIRNVNEVNATITWYANSLQLLETGNLSGGLSLDQIFDYKGEDGSYHLSARELIEGLAQQYRSLGREARRVDMVEYFQSFCSYQIEGEIMKICHQLCNKKGC